MADDATTPAPPVLPALPAPPAPPALPAVAPMLPAPITEQEIRARRMQRWMFLEQGRAQQGFGALPPNALALPAGIAGVTPGARFAAPQPGRKRFHTRDLRRIPVSVPADVRHALARTNAQGRLLPQALSEILGAHPGVAAVALALVEPSVEAPAEPETPAHLDQPRQVRPAPTHLRVTALPTNAARHAPLEWTLALSDLSALHPQTRHPVTRAVEHAQRCLQACAHAYQPTDPTTR